MRSVAPEPDRDPHLWLDLDAVRAFLPVLAESLAAHDPADEEGYRARARTALDSLDVFDAWAREQLDPVRTVPFAILHPAFENFVRHCGLNLVAVLQYQAEGEALPRTLGDITAAMRAAQAKIVFAEPHLSPKVAETMAHEIGGRVGLLDPLGLWNDRRRGGYLDLLRWNVHSLVENLSEPVQ
jgi:zinc transport system substrate-binding protein